MRIGLIASIWISVPPKDFGFGAQEYLAYYIAEGLKKRGHDVTLFATADSVVTTKLVSVAPHQVCDVAVSDLRLKDYFEIANLSEAFKMHDQFDLIHNHLLPYGLFFKNMFPTPTVHTLHHQIYKERAEALMYNRFHDQNFISISDAQRAIFPQLNYIRTVYNGIDPSFFTFKAKPAGNYLLYIGRIKKYKGIHTAIDIARKLNVPLKIAAKLPAKNQPDYKEVADYWENEVKPKLGGEIEYVGEVGGSRKVELLQDAKALIFPVEREEPFGMTVIEAAACGTPIVAYNHGAIPELVINNETGYTTSQDEGELLKATEKIYNLSEEDYLKMRKKCCEHTGHNFTIDKMIDGYEAAYKIALLNH